MNVPEQTKKEKFDMSGKVKWYSFAKGFGFIAGEDGVDYFVHHSSLDGKHTRIKADDTVTFNVSEYNGKPIATDVQVTAAADAAQA